MANATEQNNVQICSIFKQLCSQK